MIKIRFNNLKHYFFIYHVNMSISKYVKQRRDISVQHIMQVQHIMLNKRIAEKSNCFPRSSLFSTQATF